MKNNTIKLDLNEELCKLRRYFTNYLDREMEVNFLQYLDHEFELFEYNHYNPDNSIVRFGINDHADLNENLKDSI